MRKVTQDDLDFNIEIRQDRNKGKEYSLTNCIHCQIITFGEHDKTLCKNCYKDFMSGDLTIE